MAPITRLATLALLCTPSASFAQSSITDFALSGSARRISDTCIRLTPDAEYVTGSAWYTKPIDLAHPFEMRVEIALGDKDALGADGIVFVFHREVQTGFRGSGMGFAGLAPSLGIEFDTYQNVFLDDPAEDHLALMRDGRSYHGLDAPAVPLGNLEDGKRHPLRITWKPTKGLEVHLDGRLRATFPRSAVLEAFGGPTVVHWGMTAGTGAKTNAQDVCIEKLKILASL
jgi:hypothetical protein